MKISGNTCLGFWRCRYIYLRPYHEIFKIGGADRLNANEILSWKCQWAKK